MSARDVIAKHLCMMAAQGWPGISAFERAAYLTTARGMVATLTASGYRILGPDEIDAVTVEKCAEEVRRMIPNFPIDEGPRSHEEEAEYLALGHAMTAIRSLCATHQGYK